MSKQAWIIFVAIVAVVLGGLVYFSGSNKIDVSSINKDAIQSPSDASGNIGDNVYGNKDSKVILIEYGDFQCPGCGSIYPQIKTIKDDYKGEIAFVYRNLPLTTIHPNARAAAAAAQAAGLQGKYWEYHNSLSYAQDNWSSLSGAERTDQFVKFAAELSLDTEKFRKDMSSENINRKISFDQAIAKAANVTSTPTFYLNGTAITDTSDENMRKLIDEELKKNGITPPEAKSAEATEEE